MNFLQEHPKTSRLSFRRAFPPELRQHIPGQPTELKRSLGAKSIAAAGAMDRFKAASAHWEAIVDHARKAAHLALKVAEKGFAPLTPELISFLVEAYRVQELALDEEIRLLPEPSARKYRRMASLQDNTQSELAWARRVRGAGDMEEMTKYWGWVAVAFAFALDGHDIAIDVSTPVGFQATAAE